MRQNLTSLDVKFWRIKSVPALKGLKLVEPYRPNVGSMFRICWVISSWFNIPGKRIISRRGLCIDAISLSDESNMHALLEADICRPSTHRLTQPFLVVLMFRLRKQEKSHVGLLWWHYYIAMIWLLKCRFYRFYFVMATTILGVFEIEIWICGICTFFLNHICCSQRWFNGGPTFRISSNQYKRLRVRKK